MGNPITAGLPGAGNSTVIDPNSYYPIGFVLQSPINLETLYPGKWLALDGRDVTRTQYASISTYYPINVTTPTARTLNATPGQVALAADTSVFVMAGAAGTSPLQATGDSGASFSTSATWGASTDPQCIITAGTRFVMCGTAGDLTAPYVANTGQTAANIVAKSNWTVTTGGFVNSIRHAMIDCRSLGLVVGIPSGATTSVYTLADGATAWTARTVTSATYTDAVWTGTKVILFGGTNFIQTSTNATAYTDGYLPFAPSSSGFSAASDGSGTVVVVEGPASSGAFNIWTSTDHGSTWGRYTLPLDSYTENNSASTIGNHSLQQVQYVNDRFIITTTSTKLTLMSKNGKQWFNENPGVRAAGNLGSSSAPGRINAYAYNGTVYFGMGTGGTGAALSFVDDTTKFRLTCTAPRVGGSTGANQPTNGVSFQEYIKVA
jgi:hypothetical protein